MKIKTILFDIDETLYSYTTCHGIALETIDQYCQRIFGWEEGEVKKYWKIVFKEVGDRLGFDNANIHDTMLRIQTILEKKGINPLPYARAIHNLYWDIVIENMKPFDWVMPLLQEAKEQGMCLGLATDLTAEIQFRKLEKLGMTDLFDFIVTSEEANCEKPHRGIFEFCLQKSGSEARECLMIGDNWEKDIRGAMDMGMAYAWHVPGKNLEEIEESRKKTAFNDLESFHKVLQYFVKNHR